MVICRAYNSNFFFLELFIYCLQCLWPIAYLKPNMIQPWLWLTLALQAAGFVALMARPEAAPVLWVAALGAGLGGCFALSMIVALDHLHDPADAGALAALMQGGGFLLAALPPWIVAILHDFTGSFTVGWLSHLACVIVATLLYWRVSPAHYERAMGPAFQR